MKIIITGASKGIGHGIATTLATRGHAVGLLARSEGELNSLAERIRAEGGQAFAARANIRSPQETTAAIEKLLDNLGGLDALINNAGIVLRKSIFEISIEEWQALMETNVNGVFYTTRAALPTLKKQQSGHIINLSSISGRVPLAQGSAYAASKFAVTGFSESLFLEVRKHNIKVTTIFPGSVDTASDASGNGSWKLRPTDIGEACAQALEASSQNCISRIELRPLNLAPS